MQSGTGGVLSTHCGVASGPRSADPIGSLETRTASTLSRSYPWSMSSKMLRPVSGGGASSRLASGLL
jgi:hypothetical protein